jgi:hypothetical protein
MGKSVVTTSLITKAKSIWGWFIKKSPAFIVLTSITVVSIFGLGVGGTLAATGVIPNPLVAEAPIEPTSIDSDSTYQPDDDGSFPRELEDIYGADDSSVENCYRGTGDLDWQGLSKECLDLGLDRYVALQNSGWTGVTYKFFPGFMHLTISGVQVPGTPESPKSIGINMSINGSYPVGSTGCYHLGTDHRPAVELRTCGFNWVTPLFPRLGCLPGGDTYEIWSDGGNLNFRESGIIPPGIIDCPTPTPETSPTPTPETSPTPTPETSPTPTTEPSPTPTTEPSPTPTSP